MAIFEFQKFAKSDFTKNLISTLWNFHMKTLHLKVEFFREIELISFSWIHFGHFHRKFVKSKCGNFMSLLSFRFYVKSILEILEVQNLPFWHILRLWIFIFYELLHFWEVEIDQINKIRSLKMAKTADFALLESPKLISRKISVVQKSWNFHTLHCAPETFKMWS